jgi:hypothetical protein
MLPEKHELIEMPHEAAEIDTPLAMNPFHSGCSEMIFQD